MIIKNLNDRIEGILIENKNGVRNYANAENAKKAVEGMIEKFSDGLLPDDKGNIEYMILYVNNREGAGRFVPVVNFGKYMNSGRFQGGYIGFFASEGFMQV